MTWVENGVNWAINTELAETLAIYFHHRHLQATAVIPDSHNLLTTCGLFPLKLDNIIRTATEPGTHNLHYLTICLK